MIEHEGRVTRAWVLHPELKTVSGRRDPVAALAEATSLARALPELDAVGATVIGLKKLLPGTLFGSGKLTELKEIFEEHNVELVLLDGHVTPVQQRNLEKKWGVKLLDRTALILEIFSDRASTREGVLQVEMAALGYQRTRLVRAWTHLERQRGGLGFVGGPGETQIEADRRAIDDQLLRLRRQLDKVVKTRALHRAARAKVPFPIVALIGYTNAGKSTLMKALSGSNVFIQDQLFATLDTTIRAVEIDKSHTILLSDTVGFIRKLPHNLVASFRSTLKEVIESDLILIVLDSSNEYIDDHIKTITSVLDDIGAKNLTQIVLNKIDLIKSKSRFEFLKNLFPDGIYVSALDQLRLDSLKKSITKAMDKDRIVTELKLPYDRPKQIAFSQKDVEIIKRDYKDDHIFLKIRGSAKRIDQIKIMVKK